MGTPPQLTPEQRVAALAKAAASRKRRADIKSQIKNGQIGIDDVLSLATTDEAVGKFIWRWKSACSFSNGTAEYFTNS